MSLTENMVEYKGQARDMVEPQFDPGDITGWVELIFDLIDRWRKCRQQQSNSTMGLDDDIAATEEDAKQLKKDLLSPRGVGAIMRAHKRNLAGSDMRWRQKRQEIKRRTEGTIQGIMDTDTEDLREMLEM